MLILNTAIVRSFCGPIKYDQSDYLEALDLLANCDSGGLVGLQGEPVQMSINHRSCHLLTGIERQQRAESDVAFPVGLGGMSTAE